MSARCPECFEPAVESPATDIAPCWGDPPAWSHEDGSALCPVVGANGYEPAQPEFVS
ncbi:hypothetical protein [Streptomyces brasiliscabiei]|uniref:hypothetical protein n=1 Tax=Streptomyces brasiliscabiei TaxID=2736302 RepID=UPI001C105D82|nr:hypothetical protein [Streptomyces brasiliscabiei]